LGWTDGHNVQIDIRWGGGDAERIRKSAAELAALAPDVIFATGSASVGAMLRATRTVPIVFAIVPDPVGSGFVNSLSRPGGNATGFMQFEYSLSGKWLELLKQIAPGVTRTAVLWDHESARSSNRIFLCIDERGVYVLGRFSVFEARKPCAVASFSHM
jgi:ABC-type uncharacterized transport system substrate-binding protein